MTTAVTGRFLVPCEVVELQSGLWVVDVTQPVAAVLDPVSGVVRRLVSWPELPPAHVIQWYRQVLGDGSSLWVQEEESGPVVRVDSDGITVAVWTSGLRLLACGGGAAWCGPRPPAQELVYSPTATPTGPPWSDFEPPRRLLRISPNGHTTPIPVLETIRSVHAASDALMVQVDVDPWHLHHLGGDTYEVRYATRWLRLPWDADIPDRLTIESHALPAGQDPPNQERFGATGVHPIFHRYDREAASRARAWVSQWNIGPGRLHGAATAGGRSVILVSSTERWPHQGHEPLDLLALGDPPDDVTMLLEADTLDISRQCWPLVPRPLDADSYLRQIRATYDYRDDPWQNHLPPSQRQPDSTNRRTEITGDWPDTLLEWTFDWPTRPGVRIRRKIRLFDELGRIREPQYAHVHLEETLATRTMPPTTAAHEGIIDI
jgi:hypothetical protein